MKFALVLGIAALVMAGAAGAGATGGNPGMEMALVVQPHAARPCGAVYGDCSEMQYRLAEGGSCDVIVVAYNFTGMTGIQYGLDYSGVSGATFGTFHSCSTAQIRTSDAAGLYSVAQAWSTCQAPPQSGAGVMVGWMELWGGSGRIDIVPDPAAGGVVSVDCDMIVGAVAGTHPGFIGGAEALSGDTSPCGQILAAEETTWSGVKTLYR
jgi:hypothetical protein